MKRILPICWFLLSFLLFLTFAPSTRAQQTEQNTAIFTGQIIPAYLGGAYEPSEGFKKLAGLPIYVFAYDRWGIQNFVIGNYAVRTQIRADGSFQAQGLPTAAHYGVYFPFKLDGSSVVRTDGITQGVQTAEFRWPTDDDRIRDVFSYVTGDPGSIIIKDQFDQNITLGQAFLTNETRLEIDNTINVFPVVPHRVLRVTIDLGLSERDATYEVVAQRVTQRVQAGASVRTGLVATNFPTIRGRTGTGVPSGSFTFGVFQAYAPEGFYAITVWRTEGGSASYKDWDGFSPVNSINTGFAVEEVKTDWKDAVVRDPNQTTVAHRNHPIIIWGLVTDEIGYPMSLLNRGLNNPTEQIIYEEVDVAIESDTKVPYHPKYDLERSKSDLDKTQDFFTCCGAKWLPDKTTYGIYALYNDIGTTKSESLNEFSWVYINTPFYKKNPTPLPGIIDGTHGPIRVNLTASRGVGDLGYNSGLHIDTGGYSIASTRITNLTETKFFIPAVGKAYAANRLGWIHIPDKDLQRDVEYHIEVRAGPRIKYEKATYPSTGYLELNIVPQSLVLEDRYYKILGLIPVPFYVEAQGTNEVIINGTITLPENSELQNIEIFIRSAGQPKMPPCLEKDGCSYRTTDLKDGNFTMSLPKPVTPAWAKQQCLQTGGATDACRKWGVPEFWESYKINVRGTYLYGPQGTQTILDSGELMISVSDQGDSTPPMINLRLDIECGRIVPDSQVSWPIGAAINFANRIPCNIAKAISNLMIGLFAEAEHKLLRTSPITQEAGLVQIWNLVRNMVNVLFVILLIAIGIAAILRYEPKTWSPGILLPRLFIGIALSNFSLLIVQLLIDVNNVLTHFIFQYTHNILESTGISYQGIVLTGQWAGKVALLNAIGGLISGIGASALAGLVGTVGSALIVPIILAILGFFLSIVLLIIGFILIFYLRYAVIWIATAIAPLVFALGVLPATENFREMWWNTLLPFTIMQTVTAFVLSIALLLLSVGAGNATPFAGAGIFLVGIITLVLALKVPAMVSSWFKGGLLGGKELGGLMEGVVGEKGTVGAKVAGMKEKMGSAEEVAKGMAYARAKGKGKLGAILPGIAATMRGTVEKEKEMTKGVEEGTSEGLYPGEERRETQIKRAENINRMNREWSRSGHPYQGAQISEPKYQTWESFVKNAPPSMEVTAGQDFSHAGRNYRAGDRVRFDTYMRAHNLMDVGGKVNVKDSIQHFQQMSEGSREEKGAFRANFSTASTYVHGIKTS